jgi:hypothetical protein
MFRYSLKIIILILIAADLHPKSFSKANLIIGYISSAEEHSIVELEKKFSLLRVNFIKVINSGFYSVDSNLEELIIELKKEALVKYCEFPAEKTLNSENRLDDQYYLINSGQTINGKAGILGNDLNWVNAINYFSKKINNSDIVTAVIDDGLYWIGEDGEFDSSNLAFNTLELLNYSDSIDNDSNGYIDDYLGWDFHNDNNDVLPEGRTHGTLVASLIAAKGDTRGMAGVARDSKILPLKVYGGAGEFEFDDYIEALAYAFNSEVDIVNISLSGSSYNQTEKAMMDLLESKDILIVCSAGNYGRDNDDLNFSRYPASYNNDNIISVTSVDQDGAYVESHNYGLNSVDIAAPGADILAFQGFGVAGNLYEIDFKDDPNWEFGFYTNDQSSDGWFIDTQVSDTVSWMRSSSGYYKSNTESYVITNSYNLYAAKNPSLQLLIDYDLEENYDFLNVDVSTDGSSYTNLATVTGKTESFTTLNLPLNDYLGEDVMFRFSLTTDGSINKFGVTIAALTIRADEAPYVFVDGTSFSAPIVSGVCSLMKSINSDLSASDIKEILMQTSVPIDNLSNKVVSGGVVDMFNSLYAINNKQRIYYSYDLNNWSLLEDFFSNELISYELNDYYDFDIVVEYQINGQSSSGNIVKLMYSGKDKESNLRRIITSRNILSSSQRFFLKSEVY